MSKKKVSKKIKVKDEMEERKAQLSLQKSAIRKIVTNLNEQQPDSKKNLVND